MRAVLDTCVLYPTVLRGLLEHCAAAGLFVPLWSERILEEWRRAVARSHPEQARAVETEIAALTAAFPGGTIAADAGLEAAIALPDPADAHVLATAIAGQATVVVTLNLADFPVRVLARHGIRPCHPDAFLIDLSERDGPAVVAGIAAVADPLVAAGAAASRRAILKRAALPRLGRRFG